MKVRAKYIGKTLFHSNGLEYSNGVVYTIEETLFKAFGVLFEEVVTPKSAPEPKPKPEPEPKVEDVTKKSNK